MRDSETAAPARIGETSAPPFRSREERARLGKEIYERDIRHLVETDHQGEVVAIDVESGCYALGKNAIVASDDLRGRRPDAQVWLMRVGHRALYQFGGGSLRRAD